jgi:hypothetical protein
MRQNRGQLPERAEALGVAQLLERLNTRVRLALRALARLGQAAAHAVERAGQLTQLVFAVRGR